MDRHFLVPAPTGARQCVADAFCRQVSVVGLMHGFRRVARVDVNGHIELFGARQQHLEAGMIEEAAFGDAIDHRALEAEVAHTALQLISRGFWRRHRQMCEAGVAIRRSRIAAARRSLNIFASGTAAEGSSRSAPGPDCDSTSTVMPDASMSALRSLPR